MDLYSIKVRTSKEDLHISGAERIVRKENISKVIKQLLQRQSNKDFDFTNIKIEKIKEKPLIIESSLKIKEFKLENYEKAIEKAISILEKVIEKDKDWILKFIKFLYEGAAGEGKNMRGAMIVSTKGERLEKDKNKGIRTVLVDFINRENVEKKLISKGFTERTVDALALTTKNLAHSDIIAEFCISDDEHYTTGYVSTKDTYYRFLPLKPQGLNKGGRIYFVKDNANIESIYKFLREKPVLIKGINI